jgi:hypothetical protein
MQAQSCAFSKIHQGSSLYLVMFDGTLEMWKREEKLCLERRTLMMICGVGLLFGGPSLGAGSWLAVVSGGMGCTGTSASGGTCGA